MSKGGGSMKWLTKRLFPGMAAKGRCSSAAVAPAPEEDEQESEIGSLSELATQPKRGVLALQGGAKADAENLRHAAAAVADRSPEDSTLALAVAKPVPAALARSEALAAALASTDEDVDKAQDMKDVCSREGKQPLPMELLDEPTGAALQETDPEGILPPLPVFDSQKLRARDDMPGLAPEMGLGSIQENSCDKSSVVPELRTRPTSFRRRGGNFSLEPSASPYKGAASPYKSRRPGSGLYSLSSRPTTAGEESTLAFPSLRVAWNEEWTPGNQGSSSEKQVQQPLPPPLPARSPAGGEKRTMACSTPQAVALTPSSAAALQDPTALAVKQACRRTTVQWATAPTSNRSRWSKQLKPDVTDQGDAPNEVKTPVAAMHSGARPVSRELPSRPVSREDLRNSASINGNFDFSELAVSFASLDEDL